MKKIIKSLVSLSCIGLVGLALVGCKGENTTTTTSTTDSNSTTVPGTSTTTIPTTTVDADTKTYKVKAVCFNGKPIANAEIVMKGKGVTESQYTDNKGYATFELKEQTYTIYPEDLPGYTIQEDSYALPYDSTAEETVVKYDASLIMDTMPEGTSYVQGDVMYDKTFNGMDFKNGTAKDGVSMTLSSLLEENDLVVLNFWYSTCSWCIKEFPYLIDAYNSYKDKGVSLIGINTSDSASVLEEYGLELGLNFFNTYGDTELISAFKISSTPTTIMIDRYGLVGYIHSGAITSVESWTGLFDEYLADDYEPKYIPTNEEGNIDWQKPDSETGPKFPGSDALANASLASGVTAEFVDGLSEEYNANWPWIVSEDGKSIQPSNAGYDYSYALLSIGITVPANKVLAFDYHSSCETNDVLGVFIGSTQIRTISGATSDTCYLYATSDESEKIYINLLFRKDQVLSQYDDTIYISNIRFVEVEDVPYSMYVIRQAATGEFNSFNQLYENYITPVYNEEDGYYHVGSANGPLLFAALLDSNTRFSSVSIINYVYGETDYFDDETDAILTKYAQYAVNSVFNIYLNIPTEGLTPITQELYNALLNVVKAIGKNTTPEKEVLEMCVYINEYLKNGDEPIGDPIKGLAPFNAFEAHEGVNSIEYKYVFVPRGYTVKFVPEKTGVYLIKSLGDAQAVLFLSQDGNTKYETRSTPRDYYYTVHTSQTYCDPFYEYVYYEAGKTYYLSPAFLMVDEIGVLEYSIEYLGESCDYLASCSEPTFTSSDENMSDIISIANVGVALGTDGYYHVTDENGNILANEYIYADFKYITGVFSAAGSLEYLIEAGAFNFTKDEHGQAVDGEDLTALARQYLALIETDTQSIYYGIVKVDATLCDLLQKLMDKYTFAGVEGSWLKLCYYVVHLGA